MTPKIYIVPVVIALLPIFLLGALCAFLVCPLRDEVWHDPDLVAPERE